MSGAAPAPLPACQQGQGRDVSRGPPATAGHPPPQAGPATDTRRLLVSRLPGRTLRPCPRRRDRPPEQGQASAGPGHRPSPPAAAAAPRAARRQRNPRPPLCRPVPARYSHPPASRGTLARPRRRRRDPAPTAPEAPPTAGRVRGEGRGVGGAWGGAGAERRRAEAAVPRGQCCPGAGEGGGRSHAGTGAVRSGIQRGRSRPA